jgi:hypothetical protein
LLAVLAPEEPFELAELAPEPPSLPVDLAAVADESDLAEPSELPESVPPAVSFVEPDPFADARESVR